MSSIAAGTTSTTALVSTGDTTGKLVLQTNGTTTAMTIDTSQNVGIGTSSPTEKVTSSNGFLTTGAVSSTARDGAIVDYTSNIGRFIAGRSGGNYGTWEAHVAGASGVTKRYQIDYSSNHIWYAADGTTERMRIDSSGSLLVGTTATFSPGGVGSAHAFSTDLSTKWGLGVQNTNASSPWGIGVRYPNATPNTNSYGFLFCEDSSATRAYLYSNGGLANYSGNNVNLSDRREKTNFAPAKNYLDTICAIPVQTFNYIDQNLEEDPGLTLGVVAQDVQEVAPELVMESDWGTQDNPKMRLSIYQTDLQYALMKCIQELKAENDALKSRLDAAGL